MRRRVGSHARRARHLTGMGRWQAGKRACRAALREDPGDVETLALLEYARAATGDIVDDEAEGRIRVLAAQRPDLPRLGMLAAFALALRDPRAATDELVRLADEHPKDATIQANAGMRLALRDPDAGWRFIERAVQLGGRTSASWNLAWAYGLARRLGRQEAARRLLLDPLPPVQRLAVRTVAASEEMWRAWTTSVLVGAGLAVVIGSAPLTVALSLAGLALSVWLSFARLSICRSPGCVRRALGLGVSGPELPVPILLLLGWLAVDPRVQSLGWVALGFAVLEVVTWQSVARATNHQA